MTTDLRRLAEAATPGPWGDYYCEGDTSAFSGCPHEGPHHDIFHPEYPDEVFGAAVVSLDNGHEADADAALIVAMRNALPALLDVADAALDHCHNLPDYRCPICIALDRLAEVQR